MYQTTHVPNNTDIKHHHICATHQCYHANIVESEKTVPLRLHIIEALKS